MQRQDTYSVRVVVDGRDLGIWDKQNSPETDSEETTYKPGGLGDQIALGGSQTRSNITVSKLYGEDVHSIYHWLDARAGRASGTVMRQPLDADGNAWGRPIVWNVRLKRVAPPEVDSESSSAALLELEFTVNGRPA